MSDEATPDVTWEDIAGSWRLDELLEGRMRPTTSDDVLTLMTIGALRGRPPLSEAARRKALDVMMAAADDGAGAEEDQPRYLFCGPEMGRLAPGPGMAVCPLSYG